MESGQGEDHGFDRLGLGDSVETDKGVVDGGTGLMTEDDRFFVGDVSQLLLRKNDGLGGDVEGGVPCYQPKQ